MSKAPQTLTKIEADKLLKALYMPTTPAKQTRKGFRNYLAGMIMLDAGLRVGELVRLKQPELFFNKAPAASLRIRAEITKTKTERIIPLSSRLRENITVMHDQYWNVDAHPGPYYAFYNFGPHRHMSTRQIERIIKNAAIKALGRPIHPHVLRHTFGSNLMRVASMRTVQELLGHKNLTSTQVYTHPNGEDLSNAIESMSKNQ